VLRNAREESNPNDWLMRQELRGVGSWTCDGTSLDKPRTFSVEPIDPS